MKLHNRCCHNGGFVTYHSEQACSESLQWKSQWKSWKQFPIWESPSFDVLKKSWQFLSLIPYFWIHKLAPAKNKSIRDKSKIKWNSWPSDKKFSLKYFFCVERINWCLPRFEELIWILLIYFFLFARPNSKPLYTYLGSDNGNMRPSFRFPGYVHLVYPSL